MVCHSDDSSESEKKLYVKEVKLYQDNRRDTDELKTTRGIVVAKKIQSRKSPSKKQTTRIRNDSYRSDNTKDELSSDNEQVDNKKFNTKNIKVEQFSSDNDSEPNFHSPSLSRTRKHSIDNDEDRESDSQNQDRSIRSQSANDTANNLSQKGDKNSLKGRRIVVKKEPISSEDEERVTRGDPDELSPRKNLSQLENSEKDRDGNSSEGEIIPPSQFWLHKYKETEKIDEEKAAMKVAKKSSPIKNLDSDESVDSEKKPYSNTKFIGKKESPQRKSPPRIRKTEIISTKYEKVDKPIEKYKVEDEKDTDDVVGKKEKIEFASGLIVRENDNESDEHSPSKNNKSQIDSKRKLSPVKKEVTPKKAQASAKRKLNLEPKIVNKNSSIGGKLNTSNKNSAQKELLGGSSDGFRGNEEDNESDEQVSSKNEKAQKVSQKKLSPVKKEPTPKKTRASPKRKLSLEPKIVNKNSSIGGNLNTSNKNSAQKELAESDGFRENEEDNESDEQVLSKNEKSQKVSQKKLSPVKKEPTPKKARASPKRKLSLEPKIPDKSSGIEAELNTNSKNSPQKELDGLTDLRENGDDNESDEKVLSKSEKSEKVTAKKLSSVKKKQNTTKAEATPKKKLSLGPKIAKTKSSTEAKLDTSKKSSPKRNLTKEFTDQSVKSKLDVGDNDTPSEEEKEPIEKEETETPKKYILALEKPKTPSKKIPSPNGTQLVLVRKSNTKIKQNAESNSSDESQSSPQKASVSNSNDVNDDDSSEGNSNDATPGLAIKEKVSPQKKRQDMNRSDEAQPSVKKKVATKPKQQSIKSRKSTEPTPVALKRKSDADDNSSNEEEPPPSNVPKSPVRRKYPDSNSSESVSNKRAKLMPSAEKPAHTMSDSDESDETDSLTRLNTNLNKSMALMEKKAAGTVKLNKSRKSVSINTKHTLEHTPNENRIRKSILKKPEPVAASDSSESSSSSQEQTAEENIRDNVQPAVVASKIIKRPLNLRDLKIQESLAHDSTKPSFALDDVSDDDEIYILEVPRTINPRELKGQIIKLGGKNKLQVGDELYETCEKEPINISCVFRDDEEDNSYKAVNLRPAGCINVRQRLSKTLSVELSQSEKKTVPFPKNLKIRHPLFGAEYEDKIVTTGKKVSKKMILLPVKKKESITKSTKASKVEKSPKKLKNVDKIENKKVEQSLELIKTENNPTEKVEKSRKQFGNDLASSDSDSDASFFQEVKRSNIGKVEKSKKSKNSLGILDLDETPSTTDQLPDLEETIAAVKRKQLASNKKFGLSLNSSVTKNNSFDANTNTSQFFSSTPIKVENEQNDNNKGEILTDKVRKRKSHTDSLKGTSLEKKIKTN